MRYLSSAIGLSQLLAGDRGDRDGRAADEWRRLHARPDAPPDPVEDPAPRRASVARRIARLASRLATATVRRTGTV